MNIEGNGELSFFTGEIVIQKISSLSWSDSIEEHNNYGRFGLFVLLLFAEPDLSIGSVATQGTSPGKLDSF